jgi:hypothetical protein
MALFRNSFPRVVLPPPALYPPIEDAVRCVICRAGELGRSCSAGELRPRAAARRRRPYLGHTLRWPLIQVFPLAPLLLCRQWQPPILLPSTMRALQQLGAPAPVAALPVRRQRCARRRRLHRLAARMPSAALAAAATAVAAAAWQQRPINWQQRPIGTAAAAA